MPLPSRALTLHLLMRSASHLLWVHPLDGAWIVALAPVHLHSSFQPIF